MLGRSSSEESNEKKSDEESDYEASESSDDINGDDEGKSTMITRRRKSRDDDNVSLVNKEKPTMITRRRKSGDDSARNSGISIREPTVSSSLKKQKRDTLGLPAKRIEDWIVGSSSPSSSSESTRSLSINPNSLLLRSSSSSSVESQPQGNITRSWTSSQPQDQPCSSSELSRPQRYLMIAPLATDMQQRLYGFIQQPPYLPIPRGVPLCIPIVNFGDNPIQTVPGYTRVPLDATTAMCWGLFTNPSSPSLNGFNFVPSLFQGNNTRPLPAVSSVLGSVSGTVPLPAVSSVLGSSVEAQANDTRRTLPEMLNNQQQQQNHSYLAPQATGPYDLRQLLPTPQANAFPGYTQAQMEAMTRSYRSFHADPSSSNLHRQNSVSGLSPSSSLEAQADLVGGCNSGLLPSIPNDHQQQQQQQHHPSSMDVRGLDLNLPANNEDEGFDLNQPARNE